MDIICTSTIHPGEKFSIGLACLKRSTCLIVAVGEELDDEGEKVGGHYVVQQLRHLLAVHGDMRHLLHQLRPHAGLCKRKKQVRILSQRGRIHDQVQRIFARVILEHFVLYCLGREERGEEGGS